MRRRALLPVMQRQTAGFFTSSQPGCLILHAGVCVFVCLCVSAPSCLLIKSCQLSCIYDAPIGFGGLRAGYSEPDYSCTRLMSPRGPPHYRHLCEKKKGGKKRCIAPHLNSHMHRKAFMVADIVRPLLPQLPA